MYNGFPAELVTESGAARCGVDKLLPIVTRGVLLDLPAVLGVERLPEGHAISSDELDAAAHHARVDVEPGDAVLVRTGHMQLLSQGLVEQYNHDSAGPSTHTIRWFREHDVAAVFTDTYVFEVWPPQDWSCMMPVHMIHLRDMGLIQGQNWNFEHLVDVCRTDGTHQFQLIAAPEPFTGALSAPVHPVALF
jgi:kynurenine formamidase